MNTETPTEDSTRLLKSETCNSLAGTTALAYEIGLQRESGLVIRIASSNGGGLFCKDWIPLTQVLDLLRTTTVEGRVTAKAIQALFIGKSRNSGGFMAAALLSEGAVIATGDKRYELGDLDAWVTALQSLSPALTDTFQPVSPPVSRPTSPTPKKKVSGTKKA